MTPFSTPEAREIFSQIIKAKADLWSKTRREPNLIRLSPEAAKIAQVHGVVAIFGINAEIDPNLIGVKAMLSYEEPINLEEE